MNITQQEKLVFAWLNCAIIQSWIIGDIDLLRFAFLLIESSRLLIFVWLFVFRRWYRGIPNIGLGMIWVTGFIGEILIELVFMMIFITEFKTNDFKSWSKWFIMIAICFYKIKLSFSNFIMLDLNPIMFVFNVLDLMRNMFERRNEDYLVRLIDILVPLIRRLM
jgi:hypothetical protein